MMTTPPSLLMIGAGAFDPDDMLCVSIGRVKARRAFSPEGEK
jgi:hypothetical protein